MVQDHDTNANYYSPPLVSGQKGSVPRPERTFDRIEHMAHLANGVAMNASRLLARTIGEAPMDLGIYQEVAGQAPAERTHAEALRDLNRALDDINKIVTELDTHI